MSFRPAIGLIFIVGFTLGSSPAFATPEAPRLSWGTLFDEKKNAVEPVASALARVNQVATTSLGLTFPVVPSLHLEGTLDSDPARVESGRAKATFPQIFDLAVCARLGSDALKDRCRIAARAAILKWARVYHVSGNPIDEGFFVPVFLAIDILSPLFTRDERTAVMAWVHRFATEGDRFYAGIKSQTDTRRFNNWTSWRLMIRGMAAKISGDGPLIQSTHEMLATHIAGNISARGGLTYDFTQRDALHYHIYDLLPLVDLVLAAPDFFDARTLVAIGAGLGFLRPFYVGEKTHIEFLHTTVPFDIARKNAGQTEYMNLPWKPEAARVLFRLARPAFPEIRAWTGNVVDTRYDPMVKLQAAIYGE